MTNSRKKFPRDTSDRTTVEVDTVERDVAPRADNSTEGSYVLSGNLPRQWDHQVVEMECRMGVAFERYIVDYFSRMEDAHAMYGGPSLPFTLEEFSAYVRTLLVSRIRYCRKDTLGSRDRAVVGPHSAVRVPTFVKDVLNLLGVVDDTAAGRKYIPSYLKPLEEGIYDALGMQRMSTKFGSLTLGDRGFRFTTGLPKESEGHALLSTFRWDGKRAISSVRTAPGLLGLVVGYLEIKHVEEVSPWPYEYATASEIEVWTSEVAEQ